MRLFLEARFSRRQSMNLGELFADSQIAARHQCRKEDVLRSQERAIAIGISDLVSSYTERWAFGTSNRAGLR